MTDVTPVDLKVADQIIADAKTPPPAVNEPEVIAAVQTKMRELGYVNTGQVDGVMDPKGKTEAAILDVRNSLNLPLTPTIDAQLLEALKDAPAKVLPIEQITATTVEIAPKVEAVHKNIWTKFWAKVGTIPPLIATFFLGTVQYLGDAIALLTPLKTFLSDWLEGVDKLTIVFVAAGLTALVSAVMWSSSRGVDDELKNAYRDGTLGDDNKEAKAKVEKETEEDT